MQILLGMQIFLKKNLLLVTFMRIEHSISLLYTINEDGY